MFKNNTGIEVTTEQCRRLFNRLKTEEKQKNDLEISKKHTQECSKTGGGNPPVLPPGNENLR